MEVNFSVVIPLYNKEAFVEKTINSVLNQTYQNFEVIIVNDCSTDNSLNVVQKIDDSRFKIIKHNENKGLSASRNTGINAATHSYIASLLYSGITTEKLTSIYFAFKKYNNFSKSTKSIGPPNTYNTVFRNGLVNVSTNFIMMCNLYFFKRENVLTSLIWDRSNL